MGVRWGGDWRGGGGFVGGAVVGGEVGVGESVDGSGATHWAECQQLLYEGHRCNQFIYSYIFIYIHIFISIQHQTIHQFVNLSLM